MADEELLKSERVLTEGQKLHLARDTNLVSDFKQTKLENEAQRNWDLFYKRNSTNFFKDRHWTTREFNELCCSTCQGETEKKILLEVGCGVGNAFFPLLEEVPDLYVHACDFSPRAIQFVKKNPQYNPDRVNAFNCDLTKDKLSDHVALNSVNIVTMIFVLSAIHPEKMAFALKNIYEVLQPGGMILFRDYGLFDHAMLRFSPGHKLGENFYVRQDGTRAFYFSKDYLQMLFVECGYQTVENDYVKRRTVNKKEGIDVPRIFVQGKFVKPKYNDGN